MCACAIDQERIDRVIDFHGHWCPGLAIGIRASELAAERLGKPEEADMLAVVETDMCGVDAIQFLTGCTYGKGNLVHRDYGKMAFTFFDRSSGKGFRALFRPEAQGTLGQELQSLMAGLSDGTASGEERQRIARIRQEMQDRYMQSGLYELFDVADLDAPPVRPARVLQSLRCEKCGEMVMESRTRRFDRKTLCIPCFEEVEQKS